MNQGRSVIITPIQDQIELRPLVDPTGVSRVYWASMSRLREMLVELPAAADLRARVVSLRDETVQDLLSLGEQIERLTTEERNQALQTTQSAMIEMARDYDWFSEAIAHYQPDEPELAALLQEFETLPRYAFFGLLRRLDPETARRVGIISP